MRINIENESKFLVRKADLSKLKDGIETTQGYLWFKPPIRIRVENLRDSFLTIKIKLAPGVNLELEGRIPFAWAEFLMRHHKHHKIKKTRYKLGRFELDEFGARLSGLVLLEFEKRSAKDEAAIPPDFQVKEITGDARFSNHNLCHLDELPKEWKCHDVSKD